MRCGGENGILPPLPLVTMSPRPPRLAHLPAPDIRVRKAARGDLDALIELEERVFATDRLSRRSLRRFLASPSAELVVAQLASRLAGNAIVLFRPPSAVRTPAWLILFISALGGTIQSSLTFVGLARLPASTAVLVLQSCVPLAVLCAWVIGKERLLARL